MAKDIGQPTKASPRTVSGVTFRCYRAGIMQTEWRSEDGHCAAGPAWNNASYWAWITDANGGTYIPGRSQGRRRRFRTLGNAMAAAVKAARKHEA